MLLTGLGIGPSFAVFTLVVQNSVAAARIGVATGSLTFFQQIGGTIGLTLAGTVLANRLVTEIPTQLVVAGVPKPIVDQFAGGTGVDITGTGDLGQRILASLPPEAKAVIQPLIPNIVQGIHEAFSLAIASTFWVGIVGRADRPSCSSCSSRSSRCARPSRSRSRPSSPAAHSPSRLPSTSGPCRTVHQRREEPTGHALATAPRQETACSEQGDEIRQLSIGHGSPRDHDPAKRGR